MSMPSDIGVIDTLMAIPGGWSAKEKLKGLRDDPTSTSASDFPAAHLFSQLPKERYERVDPVGAVLAEMDRFGVERAMIGVSATHTEAQRALRDHPDRFFGCVEVDPHRTTAVADLRRAVEEWGVKAATGMPSGYHPPVPIDDRRWWPLYAACADLGIPICLCAGVPGPRLPAAAQEVWRIDEVCYEFPELRFVTRHGCEPWTDLAVKLLLKWPNLFYSTSAFAPRWYPRDVVEFANTRGADKVLYAGYFPMGLSLERIFAELPEVPFRDHVWPKFLRENAIRVFRL